MKVDPEIYLKMDRQTLSKALESSPKIIRTEKDYGRLKPKINRGEIYYLEVSIEFPNNLNKISFDEVVYDFVENY